MSGGEGTKWSHAIFGNVRHYAKFHCDNFNLFGDITVFYLKI